jgi:signal peptidase II
MARRVTRLFLVLFTLFLVGCDHATKLAATELAPRGTLDVVPGVLDLHYTRNDDTAFSLLHRFGAPTASAAIFLTLVSLAVLSLVLVMWWRRRHDSTRALHIGFALVVAGAAGNVIDRILRGFVVDFIHVHLWPVFNVADVAIVAGTILLALVAQSRASSRDARV